MGNTRCPQEKAGRRFWKAEKQALEFRLQGQGGVFTWWTREEGALQAKRNSWEVPSVCNDPSVLQSVRQWPGSQSGARELSPGERKDLHPSGLVS